MAVAKKSVRRRSRRDTAGGTFRRAGARTSQPLPYGRGSDHDAPWLRVVGARQNNLKNITVEIPLQRFVCVTGVSGSGKSSLVNDILREALARDLNGAAEVTPGEHDRIEGLEHLDKVIDIDQSPIGRTPRSNPATYIKVFDEIRDLFARLPDAKVRGYKPGRFSFNVQTGGKGGGRCEACEGNGSNRMDMELLADVWVTCPMCNGRRFSRETLQILYKGKSIADVLEMDVQQALDHFEPVPKIATMLRTLHDVGLDYLKLGQSSTTLSGGEAQRIKLARELVKKSTGRTLYLLDEPTTGLHFHDIKKLLAVLHGFVDGGNSVLVIEHNLDVIKTGDWIIDLGPEGGEAGGRIVAEGTPEHVAECDESHTGRALREAVFEKRGEAQNRDRKGAADIADRQWNRQAGSPIAPSPNHPITKFITVVGARQHNLKDISVEFPRDRITVCCGPSGSGKSSFAIDTVHAEGQRRYVESLSAYARQFLGRVQPPKVDHVYGLSPAICIEQKNTSRSPRSTVGTVTEIYDYMRVLWTRVGRPHCPKCRVPIGTQTADEIVERILSLGEGTRLFLLAPVELAGQEDYQQLFDRERANGYARARVDGIVYELDQPMGIDSKRRHRVELVVDRLIVRHAQASRIGDSVEQALALGEGICIVSAEQKEGGPAGETSDLRFSQHFACNQCGTSYEELTPHHFSFNTRMGWCESCEGLGTQLGAGPSAIIVHPTQSIAEGAIVGWGRLSSGSLLYRFADALANQIGFDLHKPWDRLSKPQQMRVLQGCGDEWIELASDDATSSPIKSPDRQITKSMRFQWHGFFPAIDRATRMNRAYRDRLAEMVTDIPCQACGGGRLKPEPSAVRIADASIRDVSMLPLDRALDWFQRLKFDPRERKIAGEVLSEITSRLRFLVDVGLDYLSLNRPAATLSGGEAQRIQLASQIGTGLTGVLYVLDEPTIGLHPRDNGRLIGALKRLRDLGNTLLLVEHDREVIGSADHVLDFGPGAGSFGGTVTAAASPLRLRGRRDSLTGKYLSGKESIPVPADRRPVTEKSDLPWLTVHGAREHNLKEIDAAFPVGRFTCVTGVSGSGKSTLVSEILCNALSARIHRARVVVGGHERITGLEHIDKVINVDQSPIGNSPMSNPATYTGVFDVIRELYAKLPQSKVRGYTANRFSFNRPGGRCEVCTGMGQRCIEMHFLPDVWVQCESCNGTRYVPETLEVRFKQHSIADVLRMRVSQAAALFESVPKIRRMLQTLENVGLGYVELGQAAPTLSGGEAQRVKLATELGKPSTGKTLYILDEPTTGLHFDDLKKLLVVLHRLVDLGNTVICIEHNLDVIKTADWVIDIGPEAGDLGGTIVAAGTPEQIASTPASFTGTALEPVLAAGPRVARPVQCEADRAETFDADRRIDLGDQTDMPWDKNGKAWHTVDRRDSQGQPVDWDPAVLRWLVDTIEGFGRFSPTDWAHRTRVEITAAPSRPWFCHFLTGFKDLLEVAIRVPRGTFSESQLQTSLRIKTLDDRQDLPLYGQWSRARIRTLKGIAGDWDDIRLSLRDFKDVDKGRFRAFLKTAAAAYFKNVARADADPEVGQPWKVQGQQWHLSQKSMSARQVAKWPPALLMTTVGRLRAIEPALRLEWGHKTAVHLVDGAEQPRGKIVTNMGRGLRIELRAPKNVVVPTHVDRLGEDVEIHRRPEADWIIFWIRSLNQMDAKQLQDLWRRIVSEPAADHLQSA